MISAAASAVATPAATAEAHHTEVDEHGREATVAREYATVDRAGRLQLPRDYVTALDIGHRVVLDLEPDRISVRPSEDRATDSPQEDAG